MVISADEISRNGFAIIEPQFDSSIIRCLEIALHDLVLTEKVKTRHGSAYGIRNLLNLCPSVRDFGTSNHVRPIIETVLGPDATVVRAIYFDKTPQANWKVTWHQDLTITVQNRIDVAGFTAWSTKAGIVHVQPPVSILEKMLTLRISLDDSDESNGALRTIPGSHRLGRLNDFQIKKYRESTPAVVCNVKRGGMLAMRPLLLHSSSTSTDLQHRRVVHLEFSGNDLPAGLEWYGS